MQNTNCNNRNNRKKKTQKLCVFPSSPLLLFRVNQQKEFFVLVWIALCTFATFYDIQNKNIHTQNTTFAQTKQSQEFFVVFFYFDFTFLFHDNKHKNVNNVFFFRYRINMHYWLFTIFRVKLFTHSFDNNNTEKKCFSFAFSFEFEWIRFMISPDIAEETTKSTGPRLLWYWSRK